MESNPLHKQRSSSQKDVGMEDGFLLKLASLGRAMFHFAVVCTQTNLQELRNYLKQSLVRTAYIPIY